MLRTRLPSHLLPPRAVLLARDVVLVTLPEGARPLSGNQPPYGTVSVTTPTGPLKIAALRSLTASRGDEQSDILISDPHCAEPVAPILLGQDIVELVEDVDAPSQRRLLGFLLGFCRKAFDLSRDPDFAGNTRRLAQRCIVDAGIAEPVARIGDGWVVLRGLDPLSAASVHQLGRDRTRRIQALSLPAHSAHVVEDVQPGDTILALGDHPTMWTVGTPATTAPDLLRRPADQQGLREAAMTALLEASTEFRARMRETLLLYPSAPQRHDDPRRPLSAGLDDALADGEGLMFLRGWLRDPADLVVSAELVGPSGSRPLDPSTWHRYRRPDLDKHFAGSPFKANSNGLGFVALVSDPCEQLPYQPTLRLQLHSGASVTIRAPAQLADPAAARAAVLAAVPPADVNDTMFAECLSPAAAAFHRKLLADRQRPDVVQIGTQVANPIVSLIIPLYRTLTFLRFQVAAFARDKDFRAAEVIYVLDSPEQRSEVEHLLRGLHALHDLPMRLVVMRRNLGYAAANNAGANHARSARLLLLNSDAVPAQPGWLQTMIVALDQHSIGAVGPKLLFEDGSIQHAGLLFQLAPDGLWLNAHYYKGFPGAWPAAAQSRRIPAVTGAALLVDRQSFERVGGVCEDYIIGDYEDSDFCLRLRDHGLNIFYAANVSLFHFERRSISQHRGYTGTLASQHNRLLHHRRWTDAIAVLMAQDSNAGAVVVP